MISIRPLYYGVLITLTSCASPQGGPPTERMPRPYTASVPGTPASSERVAALADLEPVWIERTRLAGLFEGRQTVVRIRLDGLPGPATDENSDYLTLTLGDRAGSQGVDTDRDGISDEAESLIGTNPAAFDSDGDTIPDGFEVFGTGTRAELADSDGDGTPDNLELNLDDAGTYSDADGDGLLNGQESASFSSDPNRVDSDGDGFADDFEYYFWTDMSDTADPDVDSDDDGQPDDIEMANGFDPLDGDSHEPDTDGDALPDFSDEEDDSAYAWVAGHRGAVAANSIDCNPNSNGGGRT